MGKRVAATVKHSKPQAEAPDDSTLSGGFKTIANALKPMSRQGSISMAQARKAVQDYVRATSK